MAKKTPKLDWIDVHKGLPDADEIVLTWHEDDFCPIVSMWVPEYGWRIPSRTDEGMNFELKHTGATHWARLGKAPYMTED